MDGGISPLETEIHRMADKGVVMMAWGLKYYEARDSASMKIKLFLYFDIKA